MNKQISCSIFLSCSFILSACQSAPQHYNGNTGYEIEEQSATTATLSYTLAARANRDVDERKLQAACQQVLGIQRNYSLTVLSINEIPNPNAASTPYDGVQVGNSRMSVGLSDTPSLTNSEGYATRQALNTKPSTLKVVRYRCA